MGLFVVFCQTHFVFNQNLSSNRDSLSTHHCQALCGPEWAVHSWIRYARMPGSLKRGVKFCISAWDNVTSSGTRTPELLPNREEWTLLPLCPWPIGDADLWPPTLPLTSGRFSSLFPERMRFLASLPPICNASYTPLSDSSSLNTASTVIPRLLKKLQIVPTAYRVKTTLLSLSLQSPAMWPEPALVKPLSYFFPTCTFLFSRFSRMPRACLAHCFPLPLFPNVSSNTGTPPTHFSP